MSVIDKKPYLVSVFEKCSEAELETLKFLINGGINSPVFRSLVSSSNVKLTSADKGVKEVVLEISKNLIQNIYNGYLIYNNQVCVLLSYANKTSTMINIIEINPVTLGYQFRIAVPVLELRSELNDALGGGGGGSGSGVASPYVLQDFELDLNEETFSCSDADAEYIFQNNPVAISLGGTIAIAKNFVDDDSKNDHIRGYTFFDLEGEDQIIYYELGLYWDGEEYSFDVKPTDPIGGGSGGGGSEQIYPINIVATPNSTNIELAPAQNITLVSMGEEAPGYTAAPYQTLNPVTYEKPYDVVLAEFRPGHQYLLPLISADSSMLLYGLTDSSMPIFDDEHPCAIMIQLNGSSIDSVMMISGDTYGPDGTEIATSLKGYFYSDENFSFNASGIRDTDIAAAISAGKIPVAIIEWKYKDYTSWCPIKSFDEDDYYFEGEYKENKFTLVCDGSYWRVDWFPVYVEDKQLGADVDYANNKIYFRSLDAMRDMQSGLPMVKLELHDYTDASRPLLGYLQLTLASQSDDKTECYYTSTQIENGDVKVTTIYVASGHTYSSGSTITIQENEYYDFNESDMTNQTKLAEVYNLCPATLRVHTSTTGLQMYRLQDDDRTQSNQVFYSCLLSGVLVDFSITESSGTYSINVVRYVLTPANN